MTADELMDSLPPESARIEDKIEAAKLWGALTCWSLRPITENPFPEMPGSYVLHAAWDFGWTNSDDVLTEKEQQHRAHIAELVRQGRPVFQPVVALRE